MDRVTFFSSLNQVALDPGSPPRGIRDGENLVRRPMVHLDNISRHYHIGGQTVKALDGVELKVPSGQFVAVVGPSGSGKSTLLNILGVLDRPDRGHY